MGRTAGGGGGNERSVAALCGSLDGTLTRQGPWRWRARRIMCGLSSSGVRVKRTGLSTLG